MNAPQSVWLIRYAWSGETFYGGMIDGPRRRGERREGATKPHAGTYSRKVLAPTLLAAYRKLRRAVRRRAASVRSIRIVKAWAWDGGLRDERGGWRLVAEWKVEVPDGW